MSSGHSFRMLSFLEHLPCICRLPTSHPQVGIECRPLSPNAVRLPMEASFVKSRCHTKSLPARLEVVDVIPHVLYQRGDKVCTQSGSHGSSPQQCGGIIWALFLDVLSLSKPSILQTCLSQNACLKKTPIKFQGTPVSFGSLLQVVL